MSGILEFVKELFSQFASGSGSFIDIANAQRGWGFTWLILILVWLLSGFASFEFANSTGLNGKKHFWIGLILPVVTLALYPMSYITRLTRSSMLDVLGQDYIRTARAKGVSERDVIVHHALKNSLIPVITYFGPELAYIVTGSLVVEQIFAVPGIGRYFVNSITGRDYTLIMGTTIVLAVLIVVMNLVSDILYKVVDPRINFD